MRGEARDEAGELAGESAAGHDKVSAFVSGGLEELCGDVCAEGDDGDFGVVRLGCGDEGEGVVAQVKINHDAGDWEIGFAVVDPGETVLEHLDVSRGAAGDLGIVTD